MWLPTDFLVTQPPLFNKADEHLNIDAWLHTIKSKSPLLTTSYSHENKAKFVAQQLRKVAHLWWENFSSMLGHRCRIPFRRGLEATRS